MNIYDDYSWLTAEKGLICSAIKENKAVFGICLGAQLIADQLGAPVTANPEKEAGWFPVIRSQELNDTDLADIVPTHSLVFHWHGDTFALPTGALPLWHSEGCANQGFIYNDRVIGTQFHFEVAEENVRSILQHDGDYLASGGLYVQTKEEITAHTIPTENKDVLFGLLDYITSSK
ncbi:glutamine amidotransferase [compost metagenome]